VAVLDAHDDVVEHGYELLGQVVERLGDETLEAVPRERDQA